MRTIILIHGIGNNNPGWSHAIKAHQVLQVEKARIIEFNYEDLMEHNWVNQLRVTAARLAASYYATPAAGLAANTVQDYIDDILMYFVVPAVRKKILNRLATLLEQHPDAILIGFSLGSVVAYETLKNHSHPQAALMTLGSPLGSPVLSRLVRRFLKVPDFTRPLVTHWFNLYSALDPISGRINKLGCRRRDQYKVKALHSMDAYLRYLAVLTPELFQTNLQENNDDSETTDSQSSSVV